MLNSTVCPVCGSKDIAPIEWDRVEQQFKEKEKYICNRCGCIWRWEQNTNKRYEDIRKLKIYIDVFSFSSYYVEVNIITGNVLWSEGLFKLIEYERKLDRNNINWFINELRRCCILNWAQEYYRFVLDGTSWRIEITFDNGCICKYGSNAYPREWNRFCKLINDLTGMLI